MQKPAPLVLVVDRESEATQALVSFLRSREFETVWARDGESAFAALERAVPDCLVTELRVQRIEGMEVLRRARVRNPEVCAVVIAEGAPVERVVEAMRQGAYDVQSKPVNLEKLLAVLQRGLSHQALVSRVAEMEESLDEHFARRPRAGFPALARMMEQVRQIASTRDPPLEGEPGAGKGLVAHVLHQASPRKSGRFVTLRCTVLDGGALEAELFGEEHPAGAGSPRRGAYELADGGTLHLEDVGSAPAGLQAKLLRAIQDRAFERVGGAETMRADVRLVASTTRDLAEEVLAGRFREDLLQRLAVVRITVPPLRERREDIPLLVESFIREFNREHARRVTGITRGVLERLALYPWPGNVRELRNAIEGMVVFAEGRRALTSPDLPTTARSETRGGWAEPAGRL
jgi:DNA-binding NtrC family response regulator